MDKNIKIQKTVYSKDAFGKVVNSSFNTFKQPAAPSIQSTVDDFFKDYEDLYLEIPINGDAKSHEYLVNRSSELLSLQDAALDIQPLLDEIADLRQQLLEANTELIQLTTENATLRTSGGN